MSAIDEFLREMVYATDGAARQSFSMDRDSAVGLLREFALADPHFYILELLQAAVANGAQSVNVVLYRYGAQVDLRVHWQGECFSRLELTNLLDYLFEAQEAIEQADRILLARGINGLLRFEPASLRIFSGGYGGDGPTEVEVDGTTGMATLREPDEEFLRRGGVTIHADDLRAMPEHLRFARARNVRWPEDLAVTERLVAEVEVLFNERKVEPRFHAEVPSQGAVHVEEPDLRGLLWQSNQPAFHLVTHGVAIERVSEVRGPFASLSGFVESPRFVKTADQYRVVRESHYDHVVARLLPYLRSGREGGAKQDATAGDPSHGFTWLGGEPVRPDELRKVMGEVATLIPLSEREVESPGLGWARFAEAVGGKVLVVPTREMANLRAIAAQRVDVALIDWTSERDRSFAMQRPMEAPPRPWLVEEIASPPMAMAEVLGNLAERYKLPKRAREAFRHHIGIYGHLAPRVFTPNRADGGDLHRDWVQLRSCGRLLWSGAVGALYPGHVLQVDLPPVSPTFLMSEASEDGESWAKILADFAVNLARAELERAAEMAVARVSEEGTEPGSVASRIALRRLSGDVILRLRVGPGGEPTFVPVALRAPEHLLRVPVVRTGSGQPLSLMDVTARLVGWGGVVPFVHAETAESAHLMLDEEQEELLSEILGMAFLEPRDEPAVVRERERERTRVQSVEGVLGLDDVMKAARAGRPLVMLDGRPGVQAPALPAGSEADQDGPLELKMNPWLVLRLREEGVEVRSGFEFPFPAEAPEEYLVQREVVLPFARATVGLLPVGAPAGKVAVVDIAAGTSTGLAMESGSYLAGVVELELKRENWREELFEALHRLEGELWEELLPRIQEGGAAQEALLAFAGQHLHLFVDEVGVRHYDVSHPLAQAVFDETLVLCGPFPVTLARLTRDYCIGDGRKEKPWLELAVELPPAVLRWSEQYLRPEREARAGRRTRVVADLAGLSQLFAQMWPATPEGLDVGMPLGVVSFGGELPDLPLVGIKDSEGTVFGFFLLDDVLRVELLPENPLVAAALEAEELTPATVALLYGIYDGLRRFYDLPWQHETAFQEALVVEMLR